MSKWFPDVSTFDGVKSALNGGLYACIAFAAMNLLGAALLIFAGRMPSSGEAVAQVLGAVVGVLLEMVFILFAGWRFRKRKGLFMGSAVTLLFVFEISVKAISRTVSGGWVIAYGAITIGLINGLRGAWAARSLNENTDLTQTFS